ncbi:hypothetical protein H7K05_19120 [Priestia aryabhattai]|uniref:hypothetical protein n=1 Tax=Priestia TaxID=2800373 RepID=UPI001455A72C|nr:hypothetical protein [Priestia aryabhattai]NLR42739.1 hypothetical protein [Priestia megaterium]MBY0007434.1 hypothetical protein [Priestia aryabhattai]MBY0044959.1 hypothetical protein [Priestia aryabhattai]MED3951352.1 hypothetical protein [Priestia aryabhattai]MED4392239.1 hypothetical protein [Priestia aryabhattai]
MLEETFTLLRPIYYLIAVFSACNLVYIIFLRNKVKASSYVIVNSFFFLIIAAALLFQEGIIVDEFNRSGDSVTFYLTMLLGFLFIASFIFQRKKMRDKN